MAEKGFLDYYLGGTGIPERLGAANELLNPVIGIYDAMDSAGRAGDSRLPTDERLSAAKDAAIDTGIAMLPAVVGRFLRSTARGSRSTAKFTPEEMATIESFLGGAPDTPDVPDDGLAGLALSLIHI